MNIQPAVDKVVIPATTPTIELPIQSDGWPIIYPVNFRQVMRLDGTVNAARARAALIDAIMRVQGELSDWLIEQGQTNDPLLTPVIEAQASTTQTFNDAISADPIIDGQPRSAHHYTGAVYCYAAARLNDRMANFDSTHQGMTRADETLPSTHTLERDGLVHIRAIKGEPSGDVELL